MTRTGRPPDFLCLAHHSERRFELTDEIEMVAKVVHSTLCGFDIAVGDISRCLSWNDVPEFHKKLLIEQINEFRAGRTAEQVWDKVTTMMFEAGWKYGHEYDEQTKSHPRLVPLSQQSPNGRRRLLLVRAVALAMRD